MSGKRHGKMKIMGIAACILTGLALAVIYMTHRAVPFMMDDLWYGTRLFDETPLRSLWDILDAQIWHYNNWGGRSVTHSILQLTLMAGETAADLLNVGMMALLAWMVCVMSGFRKLPAFLGALCLMVGCNANWKMSMFWQSGAANYLYITVFILFFLYCYLRSAGEPEAGGAEAPETRTAVAAEAGTAGMPETRTAVAAEAGTAGMSETRTAVAAEAGTAGMPETRTAGTAEAGTAGMLETRTAGAPETRAAAKMEMKEGKKSGARASVSPEIRMSALEGDCRELPGILFWIVPLGIITGWSNENMGPAVWLTTLAVMFLRRREKKGIRLWMILGNLACLAGSVMVVAAPGNFVRSHEAANGYGFLWNCFLRGYAESQALFQFLLPVLLLLLGLLLCSKGILGIPLGRKNLLLLACALLSWGAMLLSPHYPDRATFGTMILIACVILSLAKGIWARKPSAGGYLWGMLLFLWFRSMYALGEFLAISWGWIR